MLWAQLGTRPGGGPQREPRPLTPMWTRSTAPTSTLVADGCVADGERDQRRDGGSNDPAPRCESRWHGHQPDGARRSNAGEMRDLVSCLTGLERTSARRGHALSHTKLKPRCDGDCRGLDGRNKNVCSICISR
jgi:hypothetical protein